ncbi:Vms1/Ankzf1 family peptidyl-tRNA hydrolase [Streptomyces sp. NPDC059740]|uniref:baeRF2 domain-containing protein n=1 Tax=Streptomyces sp. NPDC059740 TaxID=3346926 RepID=UPI003647E8B3
MSFAFLTALYEQPGPWTTVWMDTSAHTETEAEKRALAAEDLARDLAAQGAPEADCAVVRETLSPVGRGGEAAGRALFVRAGRIVVDLPLLTAPERTEAHFAALPRITPVLRHADDAGVCLVVYVNRAGADFEVRDAWPARVTGSVEGQQYPLHRTGRADWSERHFQLKVEQNWDQNAREIAAAVAEHYQETGADTVVLVGEPRERRTVHAALPAPLQELTVETEHSGRASGSSSPLLDSDVAAVRRVNARRRWRRAYQRFATVLSPEAGETGAVEGVPLLVEAARESRVAMLLLDPEGPDGAREVWTGPEPYQVAVRRTESQYLGETEPVASRADDALVRAAVVGGAEVLVLPVDDPGGTPESRKLEQAGREPAQVTIEEDEEIGEEELSAPVGGLGALLHGTAEAH